jgi:putative lipoprotein
MNALRAPLTFAGILLLSACATAPPAPVLQGVEWVVEDIDGAALAERSRATLTLGSDGRVSGEASCNRYTGPYTISGESLSFGNLAATRRACEPALMAQETRFFTTMANVRRFEFTPDGALVLRGEPGRSIKARRG